MTVEKQRAGFKFGKWRTKVLRQCGEITEDGRTYRLVEVETGEGLRYLALRLYNGNGHFIKQFMFEPWLLDALIDLLIAEAK